MARERREHNEEVFIQIKRHFQSLGRQSADFKIMNRIAGRYPDLINLEPLNNVINQHNIEVCELLREDINPHFIILAAKAVILEERRNS